MKNIRSQYKKEEKLLRQLRSILLKLESLNDIRNKEYIALRDSTEKRILLIMNITNN